MPEENQNQEPKTLEELSDYFARIDGIDRRLDNYSRAVRSDNDELLGETQEGLARYILGPNADRVDVNNLERQFVNPGFTNKKAGRAIGATIAEIAEDYQERFDEILDSLTDAFNRDLEGAGSKEEAYRNISYAFQKALRKKVLKNVLRGPSGEPIGLEALTQEDANLKAAQRLALLTGDNLNYVDPVSTPEHETRLEYRFLLDSLGIVEEKKEGEGDKSKYSYSINKDKLKVLLRSPYVGAILYAAKTLKEEAAQQKEAA